MYKFKIALEFCFDGKTFYPHYFTVSAERIDFVMKWVERNPFHVTMNVIALGYDDEDKVPF